MTDIKLRKLLKVLQQAYDRHDDAPQCQEDIRVEFWLNDQPLKLKRIGQFSVKPDVTITLSEATS